MIPSFTIRRDGNQIHIVAYLNGIQSGMAELESESNGHYYLHNIYVPPTGRGIGIGSALLIQVLTVAENEGATVLRCHPVAYEKDSQGQPVTERTSTIQQKLREEIAKAQVRLQEWYSTNGFKLDAEDPANHWTITLPRGNQQ